VLQPAPCDGPVASANAKIGNWENFGAISIDERKDHIRKGRFLGESRGDLTRAQLFLRCFPLSTFEPLLQKWQHDA
jgi:hypothetical protein